MNASEIDYSIFTILKQAQKFSVQQEWQRLLQQDFSSYQTENGESSYEVKSNHKTTLNLNNVQDLNSFIIQLQKKQQKTKNQQLYPNTLWKIIKSTCIEKVIYKKTIIKIKQILQQTVIIIQNKLSRIVKDFVYYFDTQDDCDLKQVYNMCKFIQKSINKFAQQSQFFTSFQNTLASLKIKNSILIKDNQKLLNHIQERKQYSQKLKQKINELKQKLQKSQENMKNLQIQLQQSNKQKKQRQQYLIKSLKISHQKNIQQQKIIDTHNINLEYLDLKYINRNDLILIIKSFVLKIIKHQKQYPLQKNLILGLPIDQFIRNSVTKRKNKSNQIVIIK